MYGKIKNYELNGQKLVIQFEEQEGIVEAYTDEIINVFCGFETKDHHSKAIEGEKRKETKVSVSRTNSEIIYSTEKLTVHIADEFKVDFYDKEGTLLCEDYRGKRAYAQQLSEKSLELIRAEGHDVSGENELDYKIQIVKKMQGDEKFYGLGDKTGFLDKKHYDYEMWNSDLPQAHTDAFKALYKSVPFFITLRENCVYGLFFDNTYKSFFNMAKENEKYFYFGANEGNLDYYFIYGAAMKEVVQNYTYLTGRTPLPQLWTLGYHQSRWGYETKEEILALAKKYRECEIPCDTIHFDIDYMDGYRVFTWNEEDFGKPGEIIKQIADMGFKTVTIIDPGVKKDENYTKYKEGIAGDYFAKTPEGEVYVNAVWPGEAVYPDFGDPKVRSWWANNHKYLLELGVRGIWNDMNEPASFNGELPQDVVFTDEDRKANHAKMHNVYGHLMSKATYEGLKELDKKRPFVITRACYAGSQKYATFWTGDNQSLWAHLAMAIPQMCNMGLSGLSFIGTDVGGFGADTTGELLARWVQVGCFSPLFRNHSAKGTIQQEPWVFGDEVLSIYKKYVELRYRLLPYLYDLFYEEEKTGIPIIRPLVLHYEEDKETHEMNGEFLFGDSMLVAPVVEQGATKKIVYLPKGDWYDYDTKEKISGNKYFLKDAPLSVCPIYVKAGSILPNFLPMHYVGEIELDTLVLDVYPGTGEYLHYQDNGEDFAYRDGEYNLYRFAQKDGMLTITLEHDGYDKKYKNFEIHCGEEVKQIPFTGAPITVKVNG